MARCGTIERQETLDAETTIREIFRGYTAWKKNKPTKRRRRRGVGVTPALPLQLLHELIVCAIGRVLFLPLLRNQPPPLPEPPLPEPSLPVFFERSPFVLRVIIGVRLCLSNIGTINGRRSSKKKTQHRFATIVPQRLKLCLYIATRHNLGARVLTRCSETLAKCSNMSTTMRIKKHRAKST